MNPWQALTVILVAFFLVAFYVALRNPNGKLFPSRRDKLLRKVGPLADGVLETASLRFYTEAGGQKRVTLNATYRFEVDGEPQRITLPTDSLKLAGPGIQDAETVRETLPDAERDVQLPERLTLEDGTRLEGRDRIRDHYLERLRAQKPQVKVLYDRKRPALSTVRDW